MLKLDDPEWEYLSSEKRSAYITQAMKRQFKFIRTQIPFFSEVYRDIEVDDCSFGELIENIPLLTKEMMTSVFSPYQLLNQDLLDNPSLIAVHRGTGGTTGRPVSIFYSQDDWRAAICAHLRFILPTIRHLPKPWIVYNNYQQGHISSAIFTEVFRSLGALVISRHFILDSRGALEELIRHKCNFILTPPTNTHKGYSLEQLLEEDAQRAKPYIHGKNVHALFFSSTPLSLPLLNEIKALGISTVINFYGSTEVLPVAISCEKDPLSFHLVEGHIHATVVNAQKKPIQEGKGKLLTGRICSQDMSGALQPAQSMGFLNFYTGDEVTISSIACSCGRSTKKISDINRVANIEEKLLTGCQAW